MVNSVSTLDPTPAPVQGWTFTQGLLFGQASFVVLCLLFVRYVVFQPAEDIDQEEWARRRDERRRVSHILGSWGISTACEGSILTVM